MLHWEYCSALALGQEFQENAVYAAIAVRIRAFNCTLVGKHVCSREGVLGSEPHYPQIFYQRFSSHAGNFSGMPH